MAGDGVMGEYRELTDDEKKVVNRQIKNFQEERKKFVFYKEKTEFTIYKELPTNYGLQMREWQEKLKGYNEEITDIDIKLINLTITLEKGAYMEKPITNIEEFSLVPNSNIPEGEIIATPETLEKIKKRLEVKENG